ncbi:molybdenum cofactor biosynthesis protein MoaD [Heyndrickxia shackletonii]|uniref:Molybdopterin synthase sulfur carrier subunit n=1 Tax=Heyndrickxia shackletonii TaxID=157838 RepID=A0A0Q3WSW3_9BACI|nr:molybdopterin converting factor subunit 1 [Heyndrickxia shackletonii]KQL51162.1 molybdenum cofactor biosynthesis protein MoaD [Heyndrickxia shackletonii]MBB2479086.1 molybdopterin converting factor subunit 1 [Bacillus sp. APMAM]NEZ00559.1 molybdopterin converting factor subunit 1 [Heyndrickxia shackletonii]RTZ57232.1 molybdopterin converting factor subunit 1 [Bacillus sp. SAJ1]
MIKLLLFAKLRDQAGKQEINVDIEGKSVKELKRVLKESYSFDELDSIMVAINEEFVNDEEIIRKGDVVALIPPVSGG